MSEFAHHVNWLRPIEDTLNAPTPPSADVTEGFRYTCFQVLAQNPESEMAKRLLAKIETLVSGVRQPLRTAFSESGENLQQEEHRRVRAGVEEALAKGRMTEETHAAEIETERHCYMLSSSHYENGLYDPSKTDLATKMAQVQLFQLIRGFQENGVTSPVFVEGRMRGMGYTNFRSGVPQVRDGYYKGDLYADATQKLLAEKPPLLVHLMDTQQAKAAAFRGSTPTFYAYSSYPHFMGGHGPKTEQFVREFCENWQPWGNKIDEKYKKLTPKGEPGTKSTFRVETGWDPNGKAMLRLEGQWVYASEVAQDAENYFKYADLLANIDVLRETEMADDMLRTEARKVPIGYAGLAHEWPMVDLLKPHMHVHVLTPTDALSYKPLRRRLPINHPDCGLLPLSYFSEILRAAKFALQQKKSQ